MTDTVSDTTPAGMKKVRVWDEKREAHVQFTGKLLGINHRDSDRVYLTAADTIMAATDFGVYEYETFATFEDAYAESEPVLVAHVARALGIDYTIDLDA